MSSDDAVYQTLDRKRKLAFGWGYGTTLVAFGGGAAAFTVAARLNQHSWGAAAGIGAGSLLVAASVLLFFATFATRISLDSEKRRQVISNWENAGDHSFAAYVAELAQAYPKQSKYDPSVPTAHRTYDMLNSLEWDLYYLCGIPFDVQRDLLRRLETDEKKAALLALLDCGIMTSLKWGASSASRELLAPVSGTPAAEIVRDVLEDRRRTAV